MLNGKTSPRHIDFIVIISLFFISLIIRGIEISNVYMYPDEYISSRYVNLILANNWALTEEIMRWHPPVLYYLLAILTALSEGRIEILRMVSVVAGSLTVCFLYLLGKAVYNRKVGFLSAFFLCFSSAHCLYSRIIMLEALTILFIVAFVYFFWMGYFEEKGMLYVLMAGIALGLSFDTKYIALFLFPAIFIFVLWIRRSLKALIDKRFVSILFVAFIVILPLLISLYVTGAEHTFSLHAFKRFEVGSTAHAIRDFPVGDIFMMVVEKYVAILTRGGQNLPWNYVFQFAVLILIPITFLFYILHFIKFQAKESYLIILMFSFTLFLLIAAANHRYYLLYSFPFLFVMLSNLAISSLARLKDMYHSRIKDFTNVLRIFVVLLVAIMAFSYFITGIVSPLDKGDLEGLHITAEYVKNDIIKNGDCKEPAIIVASSNLQFLETFKHYINLNEFNLLPLYLLKYEKGKCKFDMDSIGTFKPDYIIASGVEYEEYYTAQVRRDILKEYSPTFVVKNVPYPCFVFKRIYKNDLNQTYKCKSSGKISHDLFSASVPGVVTIGKAYTVLVKVKNTGNSSTKYTVGIQAGEDYLFVDNIRSVSMDKDSTRTLKFKLVPLKECNTELRITANLYVKEYKDDRIYMICKLDSVSDSIYHIKRRV